MKTNITVRDERISNKVRVSELSPGSFFIIDGTLYYKTGVSNITGEYRIISILDGEEKEVNNYVYCTPVDVTMFYSEANE